MGRILPFKEAAASLHLFWSTWGSTGKQALVPDLSIHQGKALGSTKQARGSRRWKGNKGSINNSDPTESGSSSRASVTRWCLWCSWPSDWGPSSRCLHYVKLCSILSRRWGDSKLRAAYADPHPGKHNMCQEEQSLVKPVKSELPTLTFSPFVLKLRAHLTLHNPSGHFYCLQTVHQQEDGSTLLLAGFRRKNTACNKTQHCVPAATEMQLDAKHSKHFCFGQPSLRTKNPSSTND